MESTFGKPAFELILKLIKPSEQSATKNSRTRILVPLGKSLPIFVDSRIVLKAIEENPDQRTREGEIHTIQPEA